MNASYKTAIQFQNLYIPVKMLKVSHDSSIELNQLCKESKERVRYRKYCPSCDKEIHNEDIIKGYCYANHPDRYVTLSNEDIQSITTDEDKILKIQHFCKSREISDLLIDKSYYLIPEMDVQVAKPFFSHGLNSAFVYTDFPLIYIVNADFELSLLKSNVYVILFQA